MLLHTATVVRAVEAAVEAAPPLAVVRVTVALTNSSRKSKQRDAGVLELAVVYRHAAQPEGAPMLCGPVRYRQTLSFITGGWSVAGLHAVRRRRLKGRVLGWGCLLQTPGCWAWTLGSAGAADSMRWDESLSQTFHPPLHVL